MRDTPRVASGNGPSSRRDEAEHPIRELSWWLLAGHENGIEVKQTQDISDNP